MINKETLKVTKSQIEIDKEKILNRAKEYAEEQMKADKPKNKFGTYVFISAVFVLLIFAVYIFAIFYRHAQFVQMGL